MIKRTDNRYLSYAGHAVVKSTSDVEHFPVHGRPGLHRVFRYVTVTRPDPVEMGGHQYLRCESQLVSNYIRPNLTTGLGGTGKEGVSNPADGAACPPTFLPTPFDANRLARGRSRAAVVSRAAKKLIRTRAIGRVTERQTEGPMRIEGMYFNDASSPATDQYRPTHAVAPPLVPALSFPRRLSGNRRRISL